MTLMTRSWIWLASASIITTFAACSATTPTGSQLDTTVTANQPSFDFSKISTYSLSDTVAVIQDPNDTSSNATTTLDPSVSSFIVSQLVSHFTALGYTRLTDTSGPKPDVVVTASVMQTTHTQVYYDAYATYWGSYYTPWYGVAYAPSSYGYVVSTTLGSVIANMTDPNHPDTSANTIPSVWVAILNGIVTGGGVADTQNRIEAGFNEAFNQSPYLKRSP